MRARAMVVAVTGALVMAAVPALGAEPASARPAPGPHLSPAAAPPSTLAPRVAGRTVHVGSLDLTPCDVTAGALCGTLARAWDPTGAVAGTLDVGFAFVPAAQTSRPALGTVVPHEGGPGYSTTGSGDSYAAMYGTLLKRRNLLLVDQRGTGLTAPIDCPELQDLVGSYSRAAARCARRLAPRAHLYGTALSADDLSAVVSALGLGKVDVYGDSYGTFFTQVFASRHPSQVRSLVLDSAYPTYGETAWYPTQTAAMRGSFDLVCRETPSCARYGVPTTARISALLRRVRAHPLVGRVPAGDGRVHRLVLDAPTLVSLVFNATYGPVTYRELDAAMRALSARRDALPLQRLVGELEYPGGGVSDPSEYSEGADAAVSCMDYPQLYSMTATPSVRRTQLAAALAAKQRRDPRVYGPFSISEFLRSTWSELDWCLTWPTAPAPYRQGPIRPPGGHYPASVPVLVLSGQLDSITTPAEGAMVAHQWPSATQVVVAGSFHVTADGDTDGCAVALLRAWVVAPTRTTIHRHDACAARVPPVRATRAFPLRSADEPAASALAGSTRSRVRLSAARTTAETVADLLDRWLQTAEVGGIGLRGGRWTADGDDVVTFSLSRLRLVSDLAVSGTVVWDRYAHQVTMTVTTTGTTAHGVRVRGSALTGSLVGAWDTRARGARATVAGSLGGQRVRATMLAP